LTFTAQQAEPDADLKRMMTMSRWVLYGMPGSLYTAKARSYLRKQGLPLEQRVPGDPRFGMEILPATGRWIVPVMQTPDGAIVQDGLDIIDHVEAAGLAVRSAYPADPVEKTISLIFEMFGGEGLLRPAMHYRWNFDADNLAFLQRDFVTALQPGADAERCAAVFANSSGRMRKAAITFGVTPDTYGAVEASYHAFLALLDAHLSVYPFLLGNAPTIGDYGLIAPLHAHLSRDPHPSKLMKDKAVAVWRWVERMTEPDDDAGEFLGLPLPEVEAPETTALASPTLARLLAFVAEDYLPEVAAMVGFINDWLAGQPAGTLDEKLIERGIGRVGFTWRGHDIQVGVMPYRLILLQRIQDAAEALSHSDSNRLSALLSPAGLDDLLRLKTTRRVIRRENREWWV
jgi:glutathione S-transferase